MIVPTVCNGSIRRNTHRIIRIFCCIAITAVNINQLSAQKPDTTDQSIPVRFGKVVPLKRYVWLLFGEHRINPDTMMTLTQEEIRTLRVIFLRDSLDEKDGPQFLKVTTISTNRNEHTIDENTQYAITFRHLMDATTDLAQLERSVSLVNPMGYYNPELIEGVPILVDSLEAWGHLYVRIEPERELVKYYGRIKNKLEYHLLIRGRLVQTGFALSVPKVLYDTCDDDSVQYGNTSAMLRIYFLDSQTGERYPIDIGLGTFGVDSPIDVSKSGGGFAVSLYFDVIQVLKSMKMKMSYNINAGFDISPFFPIGHKPRLLFSARLGISP